VALVGDAIINARQVVPDLPPGCFLLLLLVVAVVARYRFDHSGGERTPVWSPSANQWGRNNRFW